jgi:CBS domain-containing protein
MLVKEVMTKEVITAEPGISVQDAAKAMDKNKIGSIVLVSKEKLVGILTERDIVIKLVMGDLSASDTPVSDIMTTDPVLIEDDADVDDAIAAMNENKVKRLPVVSGSNLVGIITVSDICALQPKAVEKISELISSHKDSKAMAG